MYIRSEEVMKVGKYYRVKGLVGLVQVLEIGEIFFTFRVLDRGYNITWLSKYEYLLERVCVMKLWK